MSKKNGFYLMIGVLGILLVAFLYRFSTGSGNKGPEKISDVIWRMFSAAKKGDSQAYLDCFTGQSLSLLSATKNESGPEAFRDYIQAKARLIKGVSMIKSNIENTESAVYEVEVVYAQQNEQQTFSLQKTEAGWKISQISRPSVVQPPIPYSELVVKE